MKKILVFLAASVLMIGNAFAEIAWNGQTETAWTEGDGTSESPYIISSPNHLAYLASQVNAGTTYTGKFFQQTEDFNMGYYAWASIGTTAYPFEGTYDGNGRYIKNHDNASLFGVINNADIQSLTMMADTSVMVSMVKQTTGSCTINNCQNIANIATKDNIGGLVTNASGSSLTLLWCNNYGTITCDVDNIVGGLVGYSSATDLTLISCHNGGDCDNETVSDSNIGGFIGLVTGGSVTIDKCSCVANIRGFNQGPGGDVGAGHFIGKVSDTIHCTIERSYAIGEAYNYLVGLCSSNTVIKGCYVRDATNYESNTFAPQATTISCYYANPVTEAWTWVDFSWSATASYCFHMCPIDIGKGTYVSKAELQSTAFLPRINIDEEYFAMDYDNVNEGYPILKWQEGIRYTITATCDATRGTVKGGGKYGQNNTVTLTATPLDGCTFVGWSDGNTDNPRTITVTGDAAYIAQFTKSQYTIYVNQDCSSYIE